MSLRIKMTLFTVLFVLLTSLSLLGISVYQLNKKEQADINRLKMNERLRLYGSLQNNVSLICSAVEDQIGNPSAVERIAGIIKRLKNNAVSNKSNWIWLLDTGSASEPFLLVSPATDKIETKFIQTLFAAARDSGKSTFESPNIAHSGRQKVIESNLFWYAKSINQSGWVLAAATPLTSIDSVIQVRSHNVTVEIKRMVKDRLLYSLLIVCACAIAIFIFSKILSDPVNNLVKLTESIAEGRKGFADRIRVSSNDEIGRLARSFNSMLEHVHNTMIELEKSAVKYRELVENANSSIIHLDCKGKVIFINEYALKLFGYAPDEIEGRSINDTIGKPFSATNKENEKIFASSQTLYVEREHLTRDGNLIWVGWTNRPLYDKDQNLIEVLCVGSDITKRKQAEQLAALQQRKLIQADKMATLGTLVAGIAHEINNPNNYIILNAQALKDMWTDIAPVLNAFSNENPEYAVSSLAYKELSSEIPNMFKGIADGALRIKAIVQSLKDFSRMEPDDLSQDVNIARVIDSAAIIIGNLIKKSTNSFSVSIPPDLPTIKGSFQKIEQVIINLLTNACQATLDTNKPVSISAEKKAYKNEIEIVVKDQGNGIKAAHLKRIFEPFYTTKRDTGGTGLGLAVSYSIVKDHGGDLRIDSEEGKGTIATLTLPIV